MRAARQSAVHLMARAVANGEAVDGDRAGMTLGQFIAAAADGHPRQWGHGGAHGDHVP